MSLLQETLVCYGTNAVSGVGGQGEFLRHMVHAIGELPRGRILSRGASAPKTECINVPFAGWRQSFARAVGRVPLLRRRTDWIQLMSEVQFDLGAAAHLQDVGLYNGVVGQCLGSFQQLTARRVPCVLSALTMHIDLLAEGVEEEYRRLGIQAPRFIHPEMKKRAYEEMRLARRIRVISEGAKQSFVERGIAAEKIDVLPPAMDLDFFRPTAQQDDVFRVLAVQSIDPRKGTYYLLQAFEKAALPNAELVIIGATGDRWSANMLDGFRRRLSNLRIQRANVMKDPVASTYGQASVFVHPAIEDGFAVAVGQALACGKPVITTRQTGASQLIRDGHNGYVLECREVEPMVELLRRLHRDRDLLGRMAAVAHEAVQELSFSSMAGRVADMYERTLASG